METDDDDWNRKKVNLGAEVVIYAQMVERGCVKGRDPWGTGGFKKGRQRNPGSGRDSCGTGPGAVVVKRRVEV